MHAGQSSGDDAGDALQQHRFAARSPRLKQLSPAVLAVLLEDLLEYNGISFRTVPLRTFREKYVGLYFGTSGSERCRKFVQHLKAFYVIVNHKFECVLVDCGQSEEEYRQHVQMTLWPTYPQGDYRALLLRKHFEIEDVPQLVVLDPNGMVVTCDGVRRVEHDQMALSFPWCDKIVDNIWGHRAQGQLKNVLELLQLPMVEGVDAIDHEIVALLFGEPWCPETRDIIRRIHFLLRSRRERLILQWQAETGDFESTSDYPEEAIACYLVHGESLEKYLAFPDFEVPFPAVQLVDEELREALHHFMGVDDPPALVIASPEEGWLLKDGAGWLARDPTGILFPWKQQVTASDLSGTDDDEELLTGLPNLLQPMTEEGLHQAICRGPVFVAFLHQVGARRAEALQVVRSALVSFLSQPPEDQEDEEVVRGRRASVESESAQFVDHGIASAKHRQRESMSDRPQGDNASSERRETLTRQLLALHSRGRRGKGAQQQTFEEEVMEDPTPMDKQLLQMTMAGRRPSRLLGEPERVLWRCAKVVNDRDGGVSQCTAPWNAKSEGARPGLGECGMTFFYAVTNDRATHLLSKFCCHDANALRQHHIWQEHHQVAGPEQERGVQEMKDRMQEFTQPLAPGASMSTPRGSIGRSFATAGVSPLLAQGGEALSQFDLEGEKDKEDHGRADVGLMGKPEARPYQPRTRFSSWRELTEELLGDGKSSQGSAMILDLARGSYHVCGNIVDQESVVRFLEGWQQGDVDAFDISILNPEELVRDEEHEVARQLAAGTHAKFLPTELDVPLPAPMPAIVIWVPTKQHAMSGEAIPDLYRSLLNFAAKKCPTQDSSALWKPLGTTFDPEDVKGLVSGGYGEHLSPLVEKLWIFGLEDCDEARAEEGFGTWEPAPSEFLVDLSSYVKSCTKKQTLDELRDIRTRADRDRCASGMWSEGLSGGGPGPVESKDSSSYFEAFSGRPQLFDEPLLQLRLRDSLQPLSVSGNYNLTLRTARRRQDLYKMMLEELGYHMNIQCPPPPLFVLFAGDLPPADMVPWPSSMRLASLQVVGSAPDVIAQREISPMVQVLEFERWLRNSWEPTITPGPAKNISVPWI